LQKGFRKKTDPERDWQMDERPMRAIGPTVQSTPPFSHLPPTGIDGWPADLHLVSISASIVVCFAVRRQETNMFTAEYRNHVRRPVLELARADPRITAGVFTGSTAFGAGDDWSDIDVVFGIAECKTFCFVGENWIIKWAVKRVKDIYPTEEKNSLCSVGRQFLEKPYQGRCGQIWPIGYTSDPSNKITGSFISKTC
jgi:hypothetical protein